VNIFALRETDPHKMRKHPAPEGPDNQSVLIESCGWANTILAAWGTHGEHLGQGPKTETLLFDH
jgi:hypothetical protein